jgi:30S ribosomal protein S31
LGFSFNSCILKNTLKQMGKGDISSKRGKIANKSYGVRRRRKIKKRPTIEQKISLKGKT